MKWKIGTTDGGALTDVLGTGIDGNLRRVRAMLLQRRLHQTFWLLSIVSRTMELMIVPIRRVQVIQPFLLDANCDRRIGKGDDASLVGFAAARD